MLLSIVAQMKWKVFLFDVTSNFLNGYLDEDVYVEQPKGFFIQGNEKKVYKLNKALYGLKQAPRPWYGRLRSYLCENIFQRSEHGPTLYIKKKENYILIICIYVDDIIYMGSSQCLIDKFKLSMMSEFNMTDLGILHYFLGLEVYQGGQGIFTSQKKYMLDMLMKFNMLNFKTTSTPINIGEKLCINDGTPKIDKRFFRRIVRSLTYLTHTRADNTFSISMISQFMYYPPSHNLGNYKENT